MHPHLAALSDSKYKPFWLDQEAKPASSPPLANNERCELLIVGGGFTGLWAALQAKEKMPELDISLIEASEIGEGASGRNGGFLSSKLAHGSTNSEFHFPGEADRIHTLGRTNLDEFVDTLQRHQIDARYQPVGELTVATDAPQAVRLREYFEEERARGEDVEWFDREKLRDEIRSPLYVAGLWERGGRDGLVDPAYLCWGLKKAVIDLGVRVFEHTPMLNLEPDRNGMKVVCPGGVIHARKVLLGTNAFPNPIARARRSVIPVWDYVVATEPLDADRREALGWQRNHGIGDYSNLFYYTRMTHDHRITWGGGGAVTYHYGNRTDSGVGDDARRFEGLSHQFFSTFPQLEGIRFTHRWNGVIASTTRFCMAPGLAFDGRVAWSIGYTGLGVGATRFGARVALELLGYDPSDVLDMQFVRKPPVSWPPEPARWLGVTLTRSEMSRADRNGGRRGLWLKVLDRLNLGFAC